MRVDQAKAMLLWDVLASLGHEPEHELRGELWYRSPFRQEKDASFKLTKDGKAWYDHGAGAGGNILDFMCRYQGLDSDDVRGALRALERLAIQPTQRSEHVTTKQENEIASLKQPKAQIAVGNNRGDMGDSFILHHVVPLQNWRLRQYLSLRGITPSIAKPYVQEMHYSYRGTPYFALAFPSDSGGYELRNPYFKGCYGTKDITTLPAATNTGAVAVFEGFVDFLSAIAYAGRIPAMPVIVLNSVAMGERCFTAIEQMDASQLHLYLDQDVVGKTLTLAFQERFSDRQVIDESGLYQDYTDFNAFLMARKQTPMRA